MKIIKRECGLKSLSHVQLLPRSPALKVDSLPSEPQGKPKTEYENVCYKGLYINNLYNIDEIEKLFETINL